MENSIKELLKDLNIDIADCNDEWELYEALDYDGSLHELIDNHIDIYYYDLRKWSVDNYEYIENAVNEGLTDPNEFDFHKVIQAGQYLYFREQATEAVNKVYLELTNVA